MQFVGLNILPSSERQARAKTWQVALTHLKANYKLLLIGLALALLTLLNTGLGAKFSQDLKAAIVNTAFASMKLEQVNYSGQTRTQEHELHKAVGLSEGTPMLQLDLSQIQASVEHLPWVKTATVSRQFPQNLYINIIEREPYAVWQLNGELWLVDALGEKITQENLGAFSNLPFLVGQGAPQEYEKIAKVISETPILNGKVNSLIRIGERRWDVMFESGTRLRLPEDSENYTASSAWLRFAQMSRDHDLLAREVAVYDMRFSDRLIVTLTERGERAPLATGEKT